jgi:hypothetical protein
VADRTQLVGDHASTTGGDMAVALAPPFLKRGWRHQPNSDRAQSRSATALSSNNALPVEIFAPDRYWADLLLEYAAPFYPAEIAPGVVWKVRLQPPATESGWAFELLSVVERWLAATKLPWVTVLYGGRSYLIRPSTDIAQFAATEWASTPATELAW